jgi:lipoprotein NlpI
LKPTWGKAYANRGIVFYQLGKRELSCDDFKNALALGFSEAQPLIDSYCH